MVNIFYRTSGRRFNFSQEKLKLLSSYDVSFQRLELYPQERELKVTFTDRLISMLEQADAKIKAALPDLWLLWCGSTFGGRLYAETRLVLVDAGLSIEVASVVGRAVLEWREREIPVESHERLNDMLLALFDLKLPALPNALQRCIFETKLDSYERGFRGQMDLHQTRIVRISKRIRKLEKESGASPEDVVQAVAKSSGVHSGLVFRVRSCGEKVITQHLMKLESALTKLEAPCAA